MNTNEVTSDVDVEGQSHIGPDSMNSLSIFDVMGRMPPQTVIDINGLAKVLGRHIHTIKRAVRRKELPRGTRLMGRTTWTAAGILRYVEGRIKTQTEQFMAKTINNAL